MLPVYGRWARLQQHLAKPLDLVFKHSSKLVRLAQTHKPTLTRNPRDALNLHPTFAAQVSNYSSPNLILQPFLAESSTVVPKLPCLHLCIHSVRAYNINYTLDMPLYTRKPQPYSGSWKHQMPSEDRGGSVFRALDSLVAQGSVCFLGSGIRRLEAGVIFWSHPPEARTYLDALPKPAFYVPSRFHSLM